MSYENLIQSISIRHTNLINKACSELFRWLNLNHFWYCRIDNEGNYSFLGSHVGWCERFADEKLLLLQKMQLSSHLSLTEGEIEVLKFMQEGLSAGQISTRVFRSPRTVEHRIERIKQKLACYSKSELIKKIRDFERLGLI